MLRIASAFVITVIGLVLVSLMPSELGHRVRVAFERNVEVQMERFRNVKL